MFILRRRLCTSTVSGSRIQFIYDAKNEVPLFYANRIGSFWFEQDYHLPFQNAYKEISNGEGINSYGSLEYTTLDPLVCISAIESIGYMPTNREIGVCTIPRLFHQHKCYSVKKWRGEVMGEEFWYHSVFLKHHRLRNLLLKEELARNEFIRRTSFNKLKASCVHAVVKHAVEVDLMRQQGCNYVIFLSEKEMGKRSAIARELAKVNVSVDELKLKMWRPEDDSLYMDTPRKKHLMTRQVVETMKRMDEELMMTHCKTGPRSEAEPVEYYEDLDRRPLYRQHYSFDNDKLVVELDPETWGRNKEAIPWEERITAKLGGKIKEVLKIVEIDKTPAELMIPRKRMRGWTAYLPGRLLPRRKRATHEVRFSKDYLDAR